MMYHRGLLVGLLVLLLAPTVACNKGSSADGDDLTPGKLAFKVGKCTVVTPDGKSTEYTEADVKKGIEVPHGSVLKTDGTCTAMIKWGRSSHILRPNSELKFLAASKEKNFGPSKVELIRGIAAFVFPKAEKQESSFRFQASANSIVAAVKGTKFQVSADPNDVSSVSDYEGTVWLFNKGSGDSLGEPLEPATLATGSVYKTDAKPKFTEQALAPATIAQLDFELEAMTAIITF